MTLVSLAKYRNKELIEALKEITRMAEDGEITGAALVLKFDKNDHRAGMLGDYKKSPAEALQAVFLMEGKLRGQMAPMFGSSIK